MSPRLSWFAEHGIDPTDYYAPPWDAPGPRVRLDPEDFDRSDETPDRPAVVTGPCPPGSWADEECAF